MNDCCDEHLKMYLHNLLCVINTCVDCKVTCHPSCAADLPNTCGLPAELTGHMFEQPPSSKKAKVDSEVEECGQLIKEGWLQVYHAGK